MLQFFGLDVSLIPRLHLRTILSSLFRSEKLYRGEQEDRSKQRNQDYPGVRLRNRGNGRLPINVAPSGILVVVAFTGIVTS